MIRMLTKDYSLSRKDGWAAYYEKTWILLPKLFNSDLISYTIYALFTASAWFMYENGGIEKTIKMLV